MRRWLLLQVVVHSTRRGVVPRQVVVQLVVVVVRSSLVVDLLAVVAGLPGPLRRQRIRLGLPPAVAWMPQRGQPQVAASWAACQVGG